MISTVCVCVREGVCRCPQSPEVCIMSPGTRATSCTVLLNMNAKNYPGSSERATSTLNHWGMSPGPSLGLLSWISNFVKSLFTSIGYDMSMNILVWCTWFTDFHICNQPRILCTPGHSGYWLTILKLIWNIF